MQRFIKLFCFIRILAVQFLTLGIDRSNIAFGYL